MSGDFQQADAEQVSANVLAEVKTHFQLIQACDTMLGWGLPWTERLLLRFMRGFYNHRLEMLMAVLPERVRGTILASGRSSPDGDSGTAVKDVYGDGQQ